MGFPGTGDGWTSRSHASGGHAGLQSHPSATKWHRRSSPSPAALSSSAHCHQAAFPLREAWHHPGLAVQGGNIKKKRLLACILS